MATVSPQRAASGRANLFLFALNSSLDLVDQALAAILDVFSSLQCTQPVILVHMHWGWQGEARQASAGVSSTVRRARLSKLTRATKNCPRMLLVAR